MKRHVLIVLTSAMILCLFSVSAHCAPYLGKEIEFQQPDGSSITIRVWGDEFYIRAETLDGYSLARDPSSGFVCYAKLNSDGSDLVSTGIPYTGATVERLRSSGLWPAAQGSEVSKGLRLKRQRVIEKADENRNLLRRDKQGRALPAPGSGVVSTAAAPAGSPAPLIGNVVGLTLLIQFPDVAPTISQAEINNYCNQVGYANYSNNGSVRDFYYGVSNGNLTYTNYVTVYYTALNNRAYYTDENIAYGTRARELINEALVWLDNPSGQNFNYGTISTDSGGYMLAINAFYVGPTVNAWAQGLWPHMSSMYGTFASNEGVKSGVYQITNIGSSLALGTFCHENGHMICGYPDLYDYGYESYGAGNYCLMAYGGSDSNPIPPNPYLRDIKGWESVTVLAPHQSGVPCSLQSNANTSYKYLNPANSKEFFYIDSRTQTGRNASLPDAGLAIWHIDENGSNNNEQMTASQHYLVSVEQADGLFHLEHNNNPGGSGDLFHASYKDIFSDTTTPSAKWWSGSNSSMVIRQISAVGSTMSFVYDDGTIPQPPVAQAGSVSTGSNIPVTITLVATDEGLPNPPGQLTYIITSLPSNGTLSDPGAGSINAVGYTLVGNGNHVIYTPNSSFAGSDSFQFKANDGGTAPTGGDSNIAAVSINVFGMAYMANMDTNPGWTATGQWQWGVPTGQGTIQYGGNPDPTSGFTGTKVYGVNLNGDYNTTAGGPYYAKTQAINCSGFEGVHLKFYRWLNTDYQPWVTATVEVSNNGSTWTTFYTNGTSAVADSSWQLCDYDISSVANNQPAVYVRWGYSVVSGAFAYSGWNIDDVMITGTVNLDTTAPTPDPMTWSVAPHGTDLHSISMTATTATDVSGVEYYFTCTSGGGHDSSWQNGTTYVDSGLAEGATCSYTVKARDKSPSKNTTAVSTPDAYGTTLIDNGAPTPNPSQWATPPYAISMDTIAMTAQTASDVSGVEYFFANTTVAGHDSGWQDSPSYLDTGLTNNTTYTYQVIARDKSAQHNETAWSVPGSATTVRYLCTGPIATDLSADCQVDFRDYAMLAAAWSQARPTVDYATNGTFDTDIVPGWQTFDMPTATGVFAAVFDSSIGNIPGSAIVVCDTYGTGTQGHYFYQTIPVNIGSQYKFSAEWTGDLSEAGVNPLNRKLWSQVVVRFENSADPCTWTSLAEPSSVMYGKSFGMVNQNIGPTGTWGWEQMTASPVNGPSDGLFTATDSYMVVAFTVGGLPSSGVTLFNVDNIKVEGPGCGSLDLNGDCFLNMKDIAAFAEQWLDCNRNPAGECGN